MAYTERGGNWGFEETDLLLKIWGKPWIQREMLTTIRNLDIYNQISTEMQRQMPHFSRTGLQCRYRIKRLKREFLRAKNEGSRRAFPFYEEMDVVLTQRAKAAKQVGESSGGKKKIKKRKSKSSEDEDFEIPLDAPEIKIEIDNAEEYEYGVSRCDTKEQDKNNTNRTSGSGGLNVDSVEKDSSDDDSKDPNDFSVTSSVVSSVDTSRADEEEYVSLPVHFYEKDTEQAFVVKSFASGDKKDQSKEYGPSHHDDHENATTGDISSPSTSLPSEPDSSVPLPLVIKSVYHVNESQEEDTVDTGKRVSSNDLSKDKLEASDDATVSREGSEVEVITVGSQDKGKQTKVKVQMSNPGEVNITDSTLVLPASGQDKKDTVSASHVIDGLPKVVNEVEKDLQIIAEWSVKTGEVDMDPETKQSCVSESDSGPDLDSEPVSPAPLVPIITSSLSALVEGSTSSLEKDAPQVSSSSSSGVMTSSSSKPPSSPSSVKIKSGSRYKIIEAGGVRTLIKLKEGDPGYVGQPGQCKRSAAVSKPSRTLLQKPSVTLLSSSSLSTGGKNLTRPMSLLSSPLMVPCSTPKVIRFEKPVATQREGYSGAAPVFHGSVRKVVVVTAATEQGQTDTVSQLLQRHKVVLVSAPSASPTTGTPGKMLKGPHSNLVPVSSNQLGGKVFHGKSLSPMTGTTTRHITPVVHAPPMTTVSVSKPLTFTTLSSLDPTPKTMTISPESSPQSAPGSAVPSSKTTIIIPRIISSSAPSLAEPAAKDTTRVTQSQETGLKEFKKNQAANQEDAGQSKETMPSTSRRLKGFKRSHEESEKVSSATTAAVKAENQKPNLRLQQDFSTVPPTTAGDYLRVTEESLAKVVCRGSPTFPSASRSVFSGKQQVCSVSSGHQPLPSKPVTLITSVDSVARDRPSQLTLTRTFPAAAASSEVVSDRHPSTGKQLQDITSVVERTSQNVTAEEKTHFQEHALVPGGKLKTSVSKTLPEVFTNRDRDGKYFVERMPAHGSMYTVTRATKPTVETKSSQPNVVITLPENTSRAGNLSTSTMINTQVTDTTGSPAQSCAVHASDCGNALLQIDNTQGSSDHPSPWAVQFVGSTDSLSPRIVSVTGTVDHLPSQSLAPKVTGTADPLAVPITKSSDQAGGLTIISRGDQFSGQTSTSTESQNVDQLPKEDFLDSAFGLCTAPNLHPEAHSQVGSDRYHVQTESPQPAGEVRTSSSEPGFSVDWTSLSGKDKNRLFELCLSQTAIRVKDKCHILKMFRSCRSKPTKTVRHDVQQSADTDVEVTNLVINDDSTKTGKQTGTFKVKAGLAQMVKGGIIMDVTTPEEARIAEEAGACAVMALERVPADIRRQGGVARMTDPKKIKGIMAAVTIPVMAKCRIGHFAEAQILESLGVDMVDESEVLTPADEDHHVDKHTFKVPFVCGARDLGEALRRISEGAAMIRTKGDAGTGDVVEAVRHARTINRQIRTARALDHTELYNYAKDLQVPFDLLKKTAELGRLPVVNFAAGGLATPADVSLLMQLGVDGVFVGSGIFKSSNPPARAHAMAQAVTHYKDPKILSSLSENLGEAMFGTPVNQQMREAAAAPGNKQQEKLWNATLALDKFKLSS